MYVPSVTTQRKIASILSAYDDLIENNTRRIAILEAMAQAIYREWFVEFRFPGHEKVKLVDSPLGKIPEGWKACHLGDMSLNSAYGESLDKTDRSRSLARISRISSSGQMASSAFRRRIICTMCPEQSIVCVESREHVAKCWFIGAMTALLIRSTLSFDVRKQTLQLLYVYLQSLTFRANRSLESDGRSSYRDSIAIRHYLQVCFVLAEPGLLDSIYDSCRCQLFVTAAIFARKRNSPQDP